jgi:hypothetical protein
VYAIIGVELLCLYRGGLCHASETNGRIVYSQQASDAIVPVALVLLFVSSPVQALGAALQRLGASLIAAIVSVCLLLGLCEVPPISTLLFPCAADNIRSLIGFWPGNAGFAH